MIDEFDAFCRKTKDSPAVPLDEYRRHHLDFRSEQCATPEDVEASLELSRDWQLGNGKGGYKHVPLSVAYASEPDTEDDDTLTQKMVALGGELQRLASIWVDVEDVGQLAIILPHISGAWNFLEVALIRLESPHPEANLPQPGLVPEFELTLEQLTVVDTSELLAVRLPADLAKISITESTMPSPNVIKALGSRRRPLRVLELHKGVAAFWPRPHGVFTTSFPNLRRLVLEDVSIASVLDTLNPMFTSFVATLTIKLSKEESHQIQSTAEAEALAEPHRRQLLSNLFALSRWSQFRDRLPKRSNFTVQPSRWSWRLEYDADPAELPSYSQPRCQVDLLIALA
jgi:hypothetical protein